MVLHITNGESAAATLRRAVTGNVTTWMDVLHEGPVPRVPPPELVTIRARYLASRDYVPEDAARRGFERQEKTLLATRQHGETVLWFEHDLYDQLLLAQVLERLHALDRGPDALTLVCIGEFPGVERFVGLGQLSAAQLASLFPARVPVTSAHFETAREAWTAFTASTPESLEALAFVKLAPLPFLADALRRLLAEYPSCEGGLGMVERLALESLKGEGTTGQAVFRRVHDREPRPFLGDVPFYGTLRDMASARRPLVATDGQPWLRGGNRAVELEAVAGAGFALTDFGRDCLEGRADAIAANGIDRWIGGVHLQGTDAAWRWDAERGRLRRCENP